MRSERSVRQDEHPTPDADARGKGLAILVLGALGVVYGDIGTSPLYAVRECFHGEYGIEPTPFNILGVLSLMFWALMLIVSLKYLVFILRADNRGEGGIVALTAQLLPEARGSRLTGILVAIGIFGGALLYGDGMITPAISVLSAVEGVGIAVPSFRSWTILTTVAILLGLFLLQKRGTHRVGMLFGPITTLWFLVLAVLGIRSLIVRPDVLAAINPVYAVRFVAANGTHGFLVLGAVLLVVTGAEALFADMGHFGRRPIRIAWYGLVLPALLMNYFGQGALLLSRPDQSEHPFYAMVPSWAMFPVIALATAATIIASQAVISGAFSLTQQAIQLGYLPRLRIVHTSSAAIGQIYLPDVNAFLMLSTIGLVFSFRSSSELAAAYGIAVTLTMAISSVLFFFVARRRWGWSPWILCPLVGAFLLVDMSFLAANFSKIGHGGWFPLAVGGLVFVCMTTWKKGRALLSKKLYAGLPTVAELAERVAADPPLRVPGTAIYLAGSARLAPPALMRNLKYNKVLHERIMILTLTTDDVPRVPRDEKILVEPLSAGFSCVTGRYGFFEEPNVPHLLALAREHGLDCKIDDAIFFIGRERIIPDRRPVMSLWREAVFAFLSLNALGATRYFHIPPDHVVEIGTQVEL